MNYGLKPLNLIFITHDLSIEKHISDNIMVLNFGKVVEFNSSKEIFRAPKHSYTKKLILSIYQPKTDI